MIRFSDSVASTVDGSPIVGAQVSVQTLGGAPAAVFADPAGTTQLTQPLQTSQQGAFGFYIADGRYTIVVGASGVEVSRADVEIVDALAIKARALLAPENDTGSIIPPAAQRASKLLAFGPDGTATAAYPNSFKGDPGAGGNVAVGRAQLKAAPATPGDVWWLSEDGRSGFFVMRAGVAPGDAYEAIYIAATAGRYWERIEVGGVYQMTWWGLDTTRTDNQLPAIQALNAPPDGSTIVCPPAGDFTISGTIFIARDKLKVVGHGRASRFVVNPAVAAFDGLVARGSDLEITQVNLSGQPSNKSSGNAYGILITSEGQPQGRVSERIHMHECIVENFSAPFNVFGRPGLTTDTGTPTATRTRKVWIHDNTFRCNVLGAVLFGAEDVWVYNNDIEWFEPLVANNSGNTVTYGARILGSKGVFFFGNRIKGGLNGTAHLGYFALKLDAASLGNGLPGNRLQNRDVFVYDNRFIDFYQAVDVVEARGTTDIYNNVFTCGDPNNTFANNVACTWSGDGGDKDGTAQIVDDCTVRGNKFRGFVGGGSSYSGVSRIRFVGNEVLANAAPDDGVLARSAWRCPGNVGPEVLEVTDNDFIGLPNARTKGQASMRVTWARNRMGEVAGDSNVVTPMAGTGIIENDQGTNAVYYGWDNRRSPVGTRAKLAAANA